jgi:FG-GAP-like repeat
MTLTRLPLCVAMILMAACHSESRPASVDPPVLSVADTSSHAVARDGQYISWSEHLIDDEQINGGIPIRGGDGLVMGDIDMDGTMDIASVHEDSHHLRIAFGTPDPNQWELVTVGQGAEVAAIEDVALGDINGDGWPDLVAACEEAHLAYFQNPAGNVRSEHWPRMIPQVTQGRGSWLRVFIVDLNQDGRMDIVGANKGAPDIIDPSTADAAVDRSTSLFVINGDPLDQSAWHEQVLFRKGVPNTALPVDIDDDGDWDVLAAERLKMRMTILEVDDPHAADGVSVREFPIRISAGFDTNQDWRALSSAFQADFADLDHDGRKDLIVNVVEDLGTRQPGFGTSGLGWLRQPASLDDPWTYFRIGNILPDLVIGISVADIDGDGDLDAITGGYSGLNILAGGYSGTSRDEDDPRVTTSSTVGRISWFENPGDPRSNWQRHDVSRRVRGMYDGFIPRDMDGDGDVDFVATRGNSGEFDGVFWLEQVRSDTPQAAFKPARAHESRALPLPPENWRELYGKEVSFIAPNKVDQDATGKE